MANNIRTIFCFVFILACPVFSFAAGITIPASCTLDVAGCSLSVSGDVTNAGTIQASSGSITLSGNWINSGTFTSGTSTITFNASSGIQVLDTGGLAYAFYNLTHNAAGTVSLSSNQVDINNNFTNSSGTFIANGINLLVGKNWNNTGTFTPGANTVTFDGSNQTIYGTTTFYNFTKSLSASADTLTFSADGSEEQTVTHFLTLKGAASNILSIEKTGANAQSKLKLQSGGGQSIGYLIVHDSNATGLMLVARNGSTGSNTTNWNFGNVTITWDGSESTDWDDPFNWDLALVPAPGDSVIIGPLGGGVLYQPVLSTDVVIGNLNILASAAVTLGGKNLEVTNWLVNAGNLSMYGSETLTVNTMKTGTVTVTLGDSSTVDVNTNTGTIILTGDDGAATTFNLADKFVFTNADNTVRNLTIADTHGTPDIFSTGSGAFTIQGNLTVSAGTLTAAGGTLDVDGNVTISTPGTLIAPASTANTAFTVGGNWTHVDGTFNNSSGKVTFDGTAQAINGTTIFYRFRDIVAGATLTFDTTGTQTFQNDLTLSGASGNVLNIRSSVSGTAANIALTSGGTHTASYVDVQDSNASGGVTLVARDSPDHSVYATYKNTNWVFGAAKVIWDGSESTDWSDALNWDLGDRKSTRLNSSH